MENEKSKILIFGATGYIGKFLVKASISLGHKTYAYARPITSLSPLSKSQAPKHFQSKGVTIVQGELDEHEKLVDIVSQVDVVISGVAYPQVLDQFKIITAIKAAGNIKRFFPSDFGIEEDRVKSLLPFEAFLEKKRKIRRAVEAAGIPFTFVSANCFAAYFVNYLLRPHDKQRFDIPVYGTGQAKAVLNYEEDIARYTIKAADDPRTLNRIIIYRPEKNIISQLELIDLWEKKTGLTFDRVHITEEELVELSHTLPHPENIPVAILHSLFVKGDLMGYQLSNDDLEALRLYPDYEYTCIDQLLDIFLVNPPDPACAAFD